MPQIVSQTKVVIYGARGVAREVHQLIHDIAADGTDLTCLGFLVDHDFREASTVRGLPVFGDVDWLGGAPDVLVTIGIGMTQPRYRIARDIENRFGARSLTLLHPRAWVGDHVAIGLGSCVCAGAYVTTDIVIGRHVQLHVGSTIGHDTTIGDYVTVAPGANVSGRVTIGEGTFVGAGAVVLPDIKIGAWAMIGAGAVVTKDIPDHVTVVGVPARIVSDRASR
jgi:sugar O-acyltransferase (sialic acid O-acetyltransferase NeuD family)